MISAAHFGGLTALHTKILAWIGWETMSYVGLGLEVAILILLKFITPF